MSSPPLTPCGAGVEAWRGRRGPPDRGGPPAGSRDPSCGGSRIGPRSSVPFCPDQPRGHPGAWWPLVAEAQGLYPRPQPHQSLLLNFTPPPPFCAVESQLHSLCSATLGEGVLGILRGLRGEGLGGRRGGVQVARAFHYYLSEGREKVGLAWAMGAGEAPGKPRRRVLPEETGAPR